MRFAETKVAKEKLHGAKKYIMIIVIIIKTIIIIPIIIIIIILVLSSSSKWGNSFIRTFCARWSWMYIKCMSKKSILKYFNWWEELLGIDNLF